MSLSLRRALKHGVYRVCHKAGLPERTCYALRHTFATHAACFGVNPWRPQAWRGQSTINITMRQAHHVEEHDRPIPEDLLAAGSLVADPDEHVVAMLSARSGTIVRGNTVAKNARSVNDT